MKIKAIAPWFGSKRTLAPRIVAALGTHRVYWEPFCGSCSVLLAKEPCVMETVNDLHGDLINVARVLQDEETALVLYGRLSRFVFHEGLFIEARERYLSGRDRDPVERAAGHGGLMKTKAIPESRNQ
jgi:DNA adenine methylase